MAAKPFKLKPSIKAKIKTGQSIRLFKVSSQFFEPISSDDFSWSFIAGIIIFGQAPDAPL